MGEREEIVRVEHIFKSFGPTKALVDVSFAVNRGEIRGLIGENGSGKSTVSSIIAGVQKADSGEMFLHGQAYRPETMVDAQNHGISMIVQEMGTIPGIGVADNIFIGKETRFMKGPLVDHGKMCTEAAKILGEIGADFIDPYAQIDDLNFEDRKIVEIARSLYDPPEVFIVDETTTALSQKGREMVYTIMRKLQAEGKSVLFISHDLEELMSICNAITVLRDGVLIDTLSREQMNVDRLRSLMVGREIKGDYYRSDYDCNYSDEVVLECIQITSGPILENFSLQLHRGEILGIGGLSECGMHEIGRVLFGIDHHVTGSVVLHKDGKDIVIDGPKTAIENKMGYVSKNRDKEAIILSASIKDNITLPSLKLLQRKNPLKLITKKSEKTLARECIESMSIKCQGSNQFVSGLSGGNKQKVVFAKWIGNGSDVLILDCPTRGIDVGVKANMYQLMARYKKEGKSIVMISEELPELIGMSDRIIILKDGVQTAEIMRSPDLRDTDIIDKMI